MIYFARSDARVPYPDEEVNWKLLSIGAFLGVAICVAALVLKDALFGRGPVTITIQIAAAVLMGWARITFGRRSFHPGANPTEGGLVTRGPYRYLRHPIYAAILYFMWAGIAAHLSATNGVIGVIASGMLAVRMRSEEILLERKYPEYAEYSRHTARVLPFVF